MVLLRISRTRRATDARRELRSELVCVGSAFGAVLFFFPELQLL
jgi:hypothetical protein